MPKNSAEYMRAYRARRKAAAEALAITSPPGVTLIADEHYRSLVATIAGAEAEVARLKRELATRLDPPTYETVQRTTGGYAAQREPFIEDAFLSTRAQTGLPVRDPVRDPMREFHPVPKSGKKGK